MTDWWDGKDPRRCLAFVNQQLVEAMRGAETAHETLVIADALLHARCQWAVVIRESDRDKQEQSSYANSGTLNEAALREGERE